MQARAEKYLVKVTGLIFIQNVEKAVDVAGLVTEHAHTSLSLYLASLAGCLAALREYF